MPSTRILFAPPASAVGRWSNIRTRNRSKLFRIESDAETIFVVTDEWERLAAALGEPDLAEGSEAFYVAESVSAAMVREEASELFESGAVVFDSEAEKVIAVVSDRQTAKRVAAILEKGWKSRERVRRIAKAVER